MNHIEVFKEFDAREGEWMASYDWEEPYGLLRSLVLVGRLLSAIFDPLTAARGMQALRLVIKTDPGKRIDWTEFSSEAPLHWEKLWADLEFNKDTYLPSLMNNVVELHVFAYYGIMPGWQSVKVKREGVDYPDVSSFVRQTVADLTNFLSLLPPSLNTPEVEIIRRTCLAATGRLKIDTGRPLTVDELAALAEVSAKQLQDAIRGKAPEAPEVNQLDSMIPAAAARKWLEAQDYLPSIWKEFIDYRCWEVIGQPLDAAPVTDQQEIKESDDFLFVPVAKDGSIFGPSLCRRRRADGKPSCTVGAKGSEKAFNNYEEALAELTKMSNARWRRPNENGNFGIVKAEEWRRMTREELFAF